jgi:dTDP-4-dehydrorhamnose reductase
MKNDLSTLNRVLIIGSTGLLGHTIFQQLENANVSVSGLARSNADYNVDILDINALASTIEECSADVVINAAGLVNIAICEQNPSLAYGINARAVSIITENCRRQGRQLVHISTDHFFTGDRDHLHKETSPVQLVNEYARSKYAGECFAATDEGALIIRTNFTGWRQNPRQITFIEWATQAIKECVTVTGYSDFFTSTLDAYTCAEAILDLLASEAKGLYNLGAADVVSKLHFLELLADRMGENSSHLISASVHGGETPRADSLGLDSRRAEKILNRNLPTTKQVIENLVNNQPS